MDFETYMKNKYAEEERVFSFKEWLDMLDVTDWLYYGNDFGCKKSQHHLDNVFKGITKKGGE